MVLKTNITICPIKEPFCFFFHHSNSPEQESFQAIDEVGIKKVNNKNEKKKPYNCIRIQYNNFIRLYF